MVVAVEHFEVSLVVEVAACTSSELDKTDCDTVVDEADDCCNWEIGVMALEMEVGVLELVVQIFVVSLSPSSARCRV